MKQNQRLLQHKELFRLPGASQLFGKRLFRGVASGMAQPYQGDGIALAADDDLYAGLPGGARLRARRERRNSASSVSSSTAEVPDTATGGYSSSGTAVTDTCWLRGWPAGRRPWLSSAGWSPGTCMKADPSCCGILLHNAVVALAVAEQGRRLMPRRFIRLHD